MSDSFTCPFCNHVFPVISSTYTLYENAFEIKNPNGIGYNLDTKYSFQTKLYRCPNYEKVTSFAVFNGSELSDNIVPIYPQSIAKHFPEYIPSAIRQDYEEAYAIVHLSPKASATLSRRCLQGMIRDFWKVSKRTLSEEIDTIKDKIPVAQWAVLDGIRRIGNIGAHMEKDINLIIDIEPDEANKLLKLIELLIQQWYIERHNQQQLYADIIGIDHSKQHQHKKKE